MLRDAYDSGRGENGPARPPVTHRARPGPVGENRSLIRRPAVSSPAPWPGEDGALSWP